MGNNCPSRAHRVLEPTGVNSSTRAAWARIRWKLLVRLISRLLAARKQFARIGQTLQVAEIPKLTAHLIRRKGKLQHIQKK